MGIFDPKVDANISPEQTVSGGPSTFQTGASILSTALSAYGSGMKVAAASGPTAGQISDAKDKSLLTAYDTGMRKAAALRAQGKDAEAQRLERTIQTNFTIEGGDPASEQATTIYENATGQTYEYVGQDPAEIARNVLMETPAYKQQLATAVAQGHEDPISVALAATAKTEGAAGIRAQADADWDLQGRAAFTQPLLDFDAGVSGVLTGAVRDGMAISEDAFGQAKAELDRIENMLLTEGSSNNLDKEQLDEIKGEVDRRRSELDAVSPYVGVEGAQARDIEALYKAASQASANGQLTQGARMLVPSILNGRVDTVLQNTSTYIEAVEFLANATVPPVELFDFGMRSDAAVTDEVLDSKGLPTYISEDAVARADSRDVKANVGMVKGFGEVFRNANPNDIATRDTHASAFASGSEEAGASIKALSNENEHMTKGGYQKMFDGGFVGGLKAMSTTHPDQARTSALIMDEAIDSQTAVLDVKMDRLAAEIPEGVTTDESGSYKLTGDVLINSGEAPDAVSRAQLVANEYYGGSLDAMIADRGRSFFSKNRGNRKDTEMRSLIERSRKTQGKIGQYNELLDSRQYLEGVQDKLAPFYEVEQEGEGLPVADFTADQVSGYNVIKDDKAFLTAVDTVAKDLDIAPEHLLATIGFETVGTYNPGVKNPNSTATGLIQFLESTAKNLGTTTEALSKMSRTEQMEYVKKYLQPFKGKLKNMGDVYMAVHWPKGVGKPDSFVMYEKGTKAYKANENLDVDNNGVVTRGEALARIRSTIDGGPSITTSELPAPEVGPEIGSTAPAQPSTPEALSLGGAVKLAGITADAGQDAQNAAIEATTDELRSKSAPQQQETPSADALGGSVAAQQDAKASLKLAQAVLSDEQRQQIRDKGYRPEETRYFATREQAEAALAAGEVKSGVLYITETGNVWRTGD